MKTDSKYTLTLIPQLKIKLSRYKKHIPIYPKKKKTYPN